MSIIAEWAAWCEACGLSQGPTTIDWRGTQAMHRPAEGSSAAARLPETVEIGVSRREAPGVITHDIVWPRWTGCAPGQFNMLGLPELGEIPISVSGGTASEGRVSHTIRATGPISAALARLEPGAPLTIRGPYGQPWPLDAGGDCPVLIVARAGGIAPLRPVIRHFAGKAQDGLPVRLVVGAQSPDELVSWRDYDAWRARGIDLVLSVDRAPLGWPWPVGAVPLATGPLDGRGGKRRRAYICGPEMMMRATGLHLAAEGFAPEDVFLSLERSMPCGVGLCGQCQTGALRLCQDGPVLDWTRAAPLLRAGAPR